jgi:hypothetical protein
MEIIHNATESLREYQKQQHNASNPAYHTTPRRSHNDENWCPPPQNSLKLNVDAHCLSDGRWALGMLLRMEDGRLVGAKTEVVHGYDKAIEAEALGLKSAIEFVDWFRDCRNTTEMDVEVDSVDQFRKRRITIEMDNKGIVEAIQNGKYPEPIGENLLETAETTLGEIIRQTSNGFGGMETKPPMNLLVGPV